MFGPVHLVLVICTRSYMYRHISSGRAHTHASVHVRTLSVNIHERASMKMCARASTSIRTHAYASIRSHASANACPSGGCSIYLLVVLYKKLLWGDLRHGSRTDHFYIRGALGDSLYHSPESMERCSFQFLGEEICKIFSPGAVFQWQVHIINTILNK